MAKLVKEIMNNELFSLRSTDIPEEALELLITLGITAAPVLDGDGKPVGIVSLRDLAAAKNPGGLSRVWSAPVAAVAEDCTIADAAEKLTDTGVHHLVVTGAEGRAVGFLGALDILRGLLGKPVAHPPSFPNYDPRTGLAWSADAPFSREHLDGAPQGPGLYMLVRGAAGESDRILWAHASSNVRSRLAELLDDPSGAPPHLQGAIAEGSLRFRTASAPSLRTLSALVERLGRETHVISPDE